MKKNKNHYLKVVEWSDEDQCYVGTAPGLILGGVHGKDEEKVFSELCEVVDEAVELLEKEGHILPHATNDKKFSGKILLRVQPALHKILALKALKMGKSVNKLIESQLTKSGFGLQGQ